MKKTFLPRNRTLCLTLAGLVLSFGIVSAQTSATAGTVAGAESAYDIMLKVYNRPQPADLSADLKMTLIDSRGRERVRELKQMSAVFDGVDKKIMEFQSPADVRGTSFMNWSYTDSSRSDDQWIYLPALKRVRRISSDGKGDSFMGSDFSYDDLGARHPEKDSHKIIGSETITGEECWIIESSPKASGETYSKTISWISKERTMGLKREFYDSKGSLLKILSVLELREMNNYLMISHTEMKNVQKNHRTTMEFGSLRIDSGVKDDVFTERALMRGL